MGALEPRLERLNKNKHYVFKKNPQEPVFIPCPHVWCPGTHRHAVGELLGRETEAVVLGLQPPALRL